MANSTGRAIEGEVKTAEGEEIVGRPVIYVGVDHRTQGHKAPRNMIII